MTRILLVEDDKGIVNNLTEFLTNEGFAVRSVNGQREALELLEQEHFDLVLLDISLADGNGFAVCSAIKTDYAIPVIFLTFLVISHRQLFASLIFLQLLLDIFLYLFCVLSCRVYIVASAPKFSVSVFIS